MHRLAVTISLALVVDSNSIVGLQCGRPGTNLGLPEQLLCVSESIQLRAEEVGDGEVVPHTQRELALTGEFAKQLRRGEEILQTARAVLREGAKALEQSKRESQKKPKQ